MRVGIRCLPCALFLVASLFPQTREIRPSFGDYPVHNIYKGKPAAPLIRKDQRMFRTMIRLGARQPVEFAGHYTVPRWGCGTLCNQFVIVDSISGRIYEVGFTIDELSPIWEKQQGGHVPARIEFYPDSRLMKINACPNEEECGFYDYIMVEGKGLKLIRKELLPSKFQHFWQSGK